MIGPFIKTPKIPREDFAYSKVLRTTAFALFVVPLTCLVVGGILSGLGTFVSVKVENDLLNTVSKPTIAVGSVLAIYGVSALFSWIAILPATEIVRICTRFGIAGLLPALSVCLAFIAAITGLLLYTTKGREDIAAMAWSQADSRAFAVVLTISALHALITWGVLRSRLPDLFANPKT